MNGKNNPVDTLTAVKSILSYVFFYFCIVMIIVGAVTFVQSSDPGKTVFGYRYYYITSSTMEPRYPTGSVVFSKVTPPEKIEAGDVIVVNIGGGSDSHLTHRVVEVVSGASGEVAFRTRGDSARMADPVPFDSSLLAGRVVFGIPKWGLVMSFMQTQLISTIGIFVILLALAYVLRTQPENEPLQKGEPPEDGLPEGEAPADGPPEDVIPDGELPESDSSGGKSSE